MVHKLVHAIITSIIATQDLIWLICATSAILYTWHLIVDFQVGIYVGFG